MSWAYKGTITITGSSTLLPSTQTNFPVLVKLDAVNCTVGGVNRVKTTANGGAVNNTGTQTGGNPVTMPFDLVFYSDSALTTKIPWEVKAYDGPGGTLWALVLMASCALGGNLYFGLGDAAVNTQQNTGSFAPSNVWDANFSGVWLLPDGATLFAKDSTTNAANGTLVNAPTSVAGQVDGCAKFVSASSQEITVPSISGLVGSQTKAAMSGWFKRTAVSNVVACGKDPGGALNRFEIVFLNDGILYLVASDGTTNASGTVASNDTNWHHLAMVYDGTQTGNSNRLKGYLDGVALTLSFSVSVPANLGTTAATFHVGRATANAAFADGSISDLRLTTGAVRSADWWPSEYQNGLAPQTFAAVSLAVNASFNPAWACGCNQLIGGGCVY